MLSMYLFVEEYLKIKMTLKIKKVRKKQTKIKIKIKNKDLIKNQSDELRAIIQSKRAEKINEDNNKKELKIEIEEDKRYSNNATLTQPNTKKEGYTKDGNYYQCDLCGKKFTKMNFESHLPECKQKHKEKKNITFVNRGNVNKMPGGVPTPAGRQPTMPAVTQGGFNNKPNLNLKFGKH